MVVVFLFVCFAPNSADSFISLFIIFERPFSQQMPSSCQRGAVDVDGWMSVHVEGVWAVALQTQQTFSFLAQY